MNDHDELLVLQAKIRVLTYGLVVTVSTLAGLLVSVVLAASQ